MFTKKRVTRLKEKLERKGLNPDRLMLEWVSAAEGQKCAEMIHRMEELEVDESEVEMSKMIFSQTKKKKVKKKMPTKEGKGV